MQLNHPVYRFCHIVNERTWLRNFKNFFVLPLFYFLYLCIVENSHFCWFHILSFSYIRLLIGHGYKVFVYQNLCTRISLFLFNCLRPNSTTSEMRNISRENTLLRKFSLVVISTVEKKFAKTQAFDWLRYFVIQNTSI
jgi:hypothetical protein